MLDVSALLDEHVVLKYECLDRLFLNGYVAKLQAPHQLAWFLCQQRGDEIPRYDLRHPGLRLHQPRLLLRLQPCQSDLQ